MTLCSRELRRSRRWMALMVLAVLSLATPAVASDPGPTFFRFDDQALGTSPGSLYPGSGVTFDAVNSECRDGVAAGGMTGAGRYLALSCAAQSPTISFSQPQVRVSLAVRASLGRVRRPNQRRHHRVVSRATGPGRHGG